MSNYLAAADDLQGIGALGIDPWAILAQGVTFLVLFIIIKKFALEKIVSMLQERHKKIDSGVRLGMKMEQEFEQLQQKIEAELQKARQGADGILSEAHQESNQIIKAAEDKAAAKVNQMMSDAEAKITHDMEQAKSALKKELVGLVAEATEVVLEEKLDDQKDMQLIERALQKVAKSS